MATTPAPSSFQKFFDLRKLDEQQLGNIEFVLNSPAYVEHFRPYMEGILLQMNRLWIDRTQARKDEYPDDFLAGGVAFGEGLLKFFDLIIHETKMERVHGAMENMTNEMLYEVRRQRGDLKPVVGLDQQAMPSRLEPEEDF
jgi:hypothetical protein